MATDLTNANDNELSDEQKVTYAEIDADANLLAYADPAIAQAGSFLTSMFGPEMIDGQSDTTVLRFTMKERCSNYDDLEPWCAKRPAPTKYVEDVVEKLRPYPGLEPEDSKWVFKDDIEFSKDRYSTRLKVRYAQDKYKDLRESVILQDRRNPNKIVTYDLITVYKKETAQYESLMTNFVEVVHSDTAEDFAEESVGFTEGSGGKTGRRLRQLKEEDKIFHSHVRKKLHGFPDVHFHEAIIGETPIYKDGRIHSWPPHVMRRLKATSMEDAPEKISELNVQVSTKQTNIVGVFKRSTNKSASNLTDFDVENDLEGAVENMPISFNETNAPRGLSEPVAVFESVELLTHVGLIVWPVKSEMVDIDDPRISKYTEHEVVHRNLLYEFAKQHNRYENENGTNLTYAEHGEGSRRRRLSVQSKRTKMLMDNFKSKAMQKKQKHAKNLQGLRESLKELNDHMEEIEKLRKERIESSLIQESNEMLGIRRRKLIYYEKHLWENEFLNDLSVPELRSQLGMDKSATYPIRSIDHCKKHKNDDGCSVKYNPGEECKNLKDNNIVPLLEDMKVMTNFTKKMIDGCTVVINAIGKDGSLKKVQDTLSKIIKVFYYVDMLKTVLKAIPFVGTLIGAAIDVVDFVINNVVSWIKTEKCPHQNRSPSLPCQDMNPGLLDKVLEIVDEYKVEDKVKWLKDKLTELRNNIIHFRPKIVEYSHLFLIADSECPSSGTETVCKTSSELMDLFGTNRRTRFIADVLNSGGKYIQDFESQVQKANEWVFGKEEKFKIDCNDEPDAPNAKWGKGCDAARWSGGTFSSRYCAGNHHRLNQKWWETCCEWKASKCQPKSTLTQKLLQSGPAQKAVSALNYIEEKASQFDKWMDKRYEYCFWSNLCPTTTYECVDVDYPCGTKWCDGGWYAPDYPCGVKWCEKEVCSYVPGFKRCKVCIGATPREIVEVVKSMTGGNMLKKLIEAGAKALGFDAEDFDLGLLLRKTAMEALGEKTVLELDDLKGVVDRYIDNPIECKDNECDVKPDYKNGKKLEEVTEKLKSDFTKLFIDRAIGVACVNKCEYDSNGNLDTSGNCLQSRGPSLDCNNKPVAPNAKWGKGCDAAKWWGGSYSWYYCSGFGNSQEEKWWETCCEWRQSQCYAK